MNTGRQPVTLRRMVPSDWEQVAAIYTEGIETGNATFQTETPQWEEWSRSHPSELRFVALRGDNIAGWVALSPVSSRCVYAGVAEVSVYVTASSRGFGLGSLLLEHLVKESEKQGLWTLQAGIFPENKGSVKLHLKAGFRIVGTREKQGRLNGIWRDVLLLERRSGKVGID